MQRPGRINRTFPNGGMICDISDCVIRTFAKLFYMQMIPVYHEAVKCHLSHGRTFYAYLITQLRFR